MLRIVAIAAVIAAFLTVGADAAERHAGVDPQPAAHVGLSLAR